MQQVLFVSEPYIRQERADRYNRQLEESQHTKWYCIRQIIEEEFLWDMRCWEKPKYQYTSEEIQAKILQWIKDHEEGNWTNNCGHCLYCLRKLLYSRALNLKEIAELVWRNNKIKYYNQFNTWNNGIEE